MYLTCDLTEAPLHPIDLLRPGVEGSGPEPWPHLPVTSTEVLMLIASLMLFLAWKPPDQRYFKLTHICSRTSSPNDKVHHKSGASRARNSFMLASRRKCRRINLRSSLSASMEFYVIPLGFLDLVGLCRVMAAPSSVHHLKLTWVSSKSGNFQLC